MVFRTNSNNTFYVFLISPDGKFGLWLLNQGYKTDLTGKEQGPPLDFTCCIPSKHVKKNKSKNHIAVAIVGSKIFCYVNDNLVFKCEEGTLQSGTVGFAVSRGSNMYAFDNFKVKECSLPDK
jgi:hypothetical protein